MNNKKIILGISIFALIISAVVINNLYSRESKDYLPEVSDDYEVTIYDLTLEEIGLSEEQYQLLVDSIMPESLEQMNAVERRNAWLLLDAMVGIEFTESAPQGQSPINYATWILDVLDMGEIRNITIVRIDREINDQADSVFDNLLMKIINEESHTYYIWYQRSGGLGSVIRGSEDGEVLYESQMHVVRDGRLCEREYARGPIVRCDGD